MLAEIGKLNVGPYLSAVRLKLFIGIHLPDVFHGVKNLEPLDASKERHDTRQM
jgi:hypothetical protein